MPKIAIVPIEQAEPVVYLGGQWNPKDGFHPLDRVSAYPSELTRNGSVPTWPGEAHRCQECKRFCSSSFLTLGTCWYCLNGIT